MCQLPVLEVDKARKMCAHGARATQKDPCFQSPQLTTSYRRYPMVTASAPTTTILPMQALVSSTLATCFCADHLRQKKLGCRGVVFRYVCGCGWKSTSCSPGGTKQGGLMPPNPKASIGEGTDEITTAGLGLVPALRRDLV